MNKYFITFIILVALSLEGCFMYSFSGSSLSKEAKTFSIQEFQSKVALGPSNLAEQLSHKLRAEIIQKTRLKEIVSNGDIQFEGVITEFKYTPIAPRSSNDGDFSSRDQLSITVQVNYSNVYDKDFEFNKKQFTQTTDIDASASRDLEEPGMVEDILKKLIKDIFNASIANW